MTPRTVTPTACKWDLVLAESRQLSTRGSGLGSHVTEILSREMSQVAHTQGDAAGRGRGSQLNASSSEAHSQLLPPPALPGLHLRAVGPDISLPEPLPHAFYQATTGRTAGDRDSFPSDCSAALSASGEPLRWGLDDSSLSPSAHRATLTLSWVARLAWGGARRVAWAALGVTGRAGSTRGARQALVSSGLSCKSQRQSQLTWPKGTKAFPRHRATVHEDEGDSRGPAGHALLRI